VKKTKISLAVAVATATMLSAPVYATNGDNLIGLGVQSRAMGGTGTAAFYGSENALTNPALLAKSKGSEFAIGGTLFKPDVSADSNIAGASASATSDADTNVIPEVSMSTRLNNNLTFGMGMYGSAGMGVDYRGNPALFDAFSNLQLMKFVPTLAYNNSNFGIGFAPVLQYGALDLNYTDPAGNNVGNGVSTDLGWGYNLGAYFDVTKELTLAVSYQSAIDMEYKDQITVAADGFGIGPGGLQTITSDNLEQPAEIKAGVAYTMNQWLMTADYKQIKWGDATGYKDFNWDDQNVYGLGVKYSGNGFWVGGGYNHGDDPIDVLGGSSNPFTAYSNEAIDVFNNHFFPAVVEDHYTFGGGYQVNKNMTIEGALVYAAEVSKTIDTSAVTSMIAGAPVSSSHEVTHSQIGYSFSLRMNF